MKDLNKGDYWTNLLLSMKSLPVLEGIDKNLAQTYLKDHNLPNPFSSTSITDIENSLERLGLYFQKEASIVHSVFCAVKIIYRLILSHVF